MWSTIRSTAARQLRVARAAKVNTGLSASSRVANGPASFVVPTSYRLVISSRSFTDTSDQLAAKAAAAAAKPRASKSKSTTTTTAAKKTKKPAAKKKAAAKKTATKKTTVKKAKKPVKKAAPKKVKKVLDPEVKRKLDIRELKKIALLQEPKRLPDQPWMVYISQNSQTLTPGTLGETVKGLATAYNSLGSFEKQRLETAASQNRLANEAAYKAWVQSHTPIEVDAANRARQKLRRISPTHKRKLDIKDERIPKRSASAYALFTKWRWDSGELAGDSVKDAAVSISSQWKSLTAADKKAFEDSAAADSDRYAKEVQLVLNRKIDRRSSSPSP